ncbi:MAG: hypothetical protein A3C30_01180 [Candidatus Levybacteria bacterium RIFCSPHIGHO2_02_FULL_40_18]|nr:MAG: hypothetical protein A2869_00745 [Candidatus Levybacteria bacterium RIFCSPHIGHO2_01_FULL_40_58]OGH26616.1 MAG: hypothetical protein A3C30_01180 [Candidatus Levybacteria bacterium RIFCSPHIGHO2_02_FULL_40_18]OGH39827.1 MAG: hypothetical protein A2894_03520 [Candidatus Levybacteria bacterium RIFCSPLOWO2_01_FULL_40_64]OGH48851.1 MAG: hypothetical protein A3I54_04625 [Candidatus Levybacteria bacterium RIFCSPLOWO2_02_FULL_41_11]OGH53167.1 MAG: hypothetical protein A3G15_02250 [Candidatus Levy
MEEPPVLNKNSLIFNHEALTNQTLFATVFQYMIPSWNNAGRPKKVKTGTIGFNSQTKNLEFFNGSSWLKLPMKKI